MITYTYVQNSHKHTQHFSVSAQAVLQYALDDIDECVASPVSIENEQGIVIYNQTTIFRIYMRPFFIKMANKAAPYESNKR